MAAQLHIVPISGVLGAEIEGIDLTRPIAEEQIAALKQALNRYQLLVFRDQKITAQQQVDFASRFGPVAPGMVNAQDEPAPGITVVNSLYSKKFTDKWHTDHTWSECPPMAAMLHAIEVPSVGGDTLWANMAAAYEALSAPMQAMLDGLTAMHSAEALMRLFADAKMNFSYSMDHSAATVHPVVRVHPDTGQKILFVNANFTTRILELGETESRAVLDFLFEHMRSTHFQCRVTWQRDTVVLWDERSTHHFAMPDYDEPRILHRLMIDGDKPVSARRVPLAA